MIFILNGDLTRIVDFLSCRIWKSKETQNQLKEAQKESYEERKRELNMAVVLLWVVILFITCQSIKIIPDIYEALYCSTQEVGPFDFIVLWLIYVHAILHGEKSICGFFRINTMAFLFPPHLVANWLYHVFLLDEKH